MNGELPLASAPERADIARQVRAASSSFYWAMRLLARPRREAIFAVYAFCRAVDDIADSDHTVARKKALLAEWRGEIHSLFGGRPSRPISRALIEPVQAFGLERGNFMAVIEGMEMDVDGPIVAPSRGELDLYCDRVACAVGRLCVPIFGETGETGIAVADRLGRALQLTNILRDVVEDADEGRLYIPRELLEAHDVPVSGPAMSPQQALAHPGFTLAWRALAREVEAEFAAAQQAMQHCDRRNIRPARIMMEVYRRNLERMQALTDAALADRSVSKRLVGPAEKLAIALRYGFV